MSLSPLVLQIVFIGCAAVAGLGAGGALVAHNFNRSSRSNFNGLAETLFGAFLGCGIALLLAALTSWRLSPIQITRGIGLLLLILMIEFGWIYARMKAGE